MQTLDKVKEIVSEQLSIKAKNITKHSDLFDDYGADSLDIVEIVVLIEEELCVEIPDKESEKFRTVNDIAKFLEGIKQ